MSDDDSRKLPGIHDSMTGSGKKRPVGCFGCLGVVLGIVILGAIIGLLIGNRGGSNSSNTNNRYEATAQCEDRVRALLKAPSTAKFSSTATGNQTWTVTGTVDSENGFGATIRADFQCTVKISGSSATTTVDYLK